MEPWKQFGGMSSGSDEPAVEEKEEVKALPWKEFAKEHFLSPSLSDDIDTVRSLAQNMVAGPTAAGIHTFRDVVSGKTPLNMEHMAKRFEKHSKDYEYEPKTDKSKTITDAVSSGFETAMRGAGSAAENLVRAIPFSGPELADKYWPELQTAGEVAAQFAPIGGAGAKAKQMHGRPTPEMIQQLKDKHAASSTPQQAPWESFKADLFDGEASAIPPEMKTPWNLPEGEASRISREIEAQVADTTQGQLFPTQELAAKAREDGMLGPQEPSLRSKERPMSMQETLRESSPLREQGLYESTAESSVSTPIRVGGDDPRTITHNLMDDGRLEKTIVYDDGTTQKYFLVEDKNGNQIWVSLEQYEKGNYFPVQLSESGALQLIKDENPNSINLESMKGKTLGDVQGTPGFLQSAEQKLYKVDDLAIEKAREAGIADAQFGSSAFDTWNDKLAEAMQESHYWQSLGDKYTKGRENPNRTGLHIIETTSKSPFYRKLANLLLKDPTFKPDFQLRESFSRDGKPSNTAGRYDASKYKTSYKTELSGSEQLVLHENIHAATHTPIQAVLTGKVPPQLREAAIPARRIIDLFESLQKEAIRQSGLYDFRKEYNVSQQYGMKNPHEFIAEGFTNPQFQVLLAQIKLPKELQKKGLSYYWDAFVHAVTEMFGLRGKEATYLSELLRSGAELISKTKSEQRIWYGDMMDTAKDLGASFKDGGEFVGGMQEAGREFHLDRRPIEEVVKSLPKKLEDFTGPSKSQAGRVLSRLGSMVKANLLPDQTLKLLMQNKEGTGPLVKWTVDQVSRIERATTNKVKEAVDTALVPFRRMYHNKALRRELSEMHKKWMENVGVRDLTKADFTTDRQWQVYSHFQGAHDRILKEINEAREKAGIKPIARIPSYFHAGWEGDYRVFGYNSSNEKVFAQGFATEVQAHKAAAAMQRAHPDMRIEPDHIITDKYSLNTDAFEQALKIMSKDDPVTRALQKTYNDILSHKGFGRTGVHRKGIKGFLGENSLKDMERAYESYVNHAYKYMGNLEKQLVLKGLSEVPLEMRKQVPETMDFLHDYVRKSQGAKIGEMAWDRILDQTSRALGLGESGPRKAIHELGSVAMMYWLTTPRFILSQMVQAMNASPKLVQEFGFVEGNKMVFEGFKNAIAPDKLAKEAATWASDHGYLDSTVKTLVGKGMKEIPVGSRWEAAKELVAKPASYVEHHMVRLPAFLMFEKSLREKVPNKAKRFEEAAEKMDYYMVNYGRTHTPLVYDKLGHLGEAARPLKQYSHNAFGQFLEYAADAKKGDVAPLAQFMGIQALMGGLKGTMLVAEAGVIITAINALFDLDIDTPEKFLLKNGVHDALIYGGLSHILGHDISSSVSAPSLPQMFSFPPIEFTAGLVKDATNYIVQTAKGTATDQDRLKFALAVSPNLMHEFWKNVFTPEGMPTANPNDPQLRGNYRRDETERWSAALMATKPLSEAKADAIIREAKKQLKRDYMQKMDATDAIVDQMQNGKEVDPKLFERYLKEGGDPKLLAKTIVDRIKQRMQTGEERLQDFKTMTPQQMHKNEVINQYLNKMTPPVEQPHGVTPEGDIKPMRDTTPRDMDRPDVKSDKPYPYLPNKKFGSYKKDGVQTWSDSDPEPSIENRPYQKAEMFPKQSTINPNEYTSRMSDSDSQLTRYLRHKLNRVDNESYQRWAKREAEVKAKTARSQYGRIYKYPEKHGT